MNQQLRRKLDHITDILWAGGVTNPVTYIEQISYLIFLKLLDEESPTASCALASVPPAATPRFCIPRSPSATAGATGVSKAVLNCRDFIRDEVFPYMASLAKDEPGWPNTSVTRSWKSLIPTC